MSKPWKLILLLAGIFIAGSVSGVFCTMQFGQKWIATPESGPDQWVPTHLKKLTERLDLTPEQTEQLRPIVRKNMEELSRQRSESWNATKEIFERMHREVAEKLTPEQRIKYEQLNKEMRERAKKAMPERKPRKDESDREKPKSSESEAPPQREKAPDGE